MQGASTIRNLLQTDYPTDFLTVFDLLDYNIGKGILIRDTWYKVVRQKKRMGSKKSVSNSMFKLEPAAEYHEKDPDKIEQALMAPLANNGWVTFKQIVDNVNNGVWGFQHKDIYRGNQGWFGIESPRHEG